MHSPESKVDVELAVRDPADYFSSPMDVINDSHFTAAEKQRILESWAQDALLLSEAENENMPGEDPPLQEVRVALLELQKQK